jgi:hypothetical protein
MVRLLYNSSSVTWLVGPRLETSFRRGWIRLPGYSSWLPSADVDGAWDGSWGCLYITLLYLGAKSSHVGVDMDGIACHLHRRTDCG